MVYDPLALTGSSNYWNYSNKNKEGYSLNLQGTVIQIDTPHAKDINGVAKYFKDGKPIRNCCFTIRTVGGDDVRWEFTMNKRSKVMQALMSAIPGCTSIRQFLGQNIAVQTQEPPEGFAWCVSSPRPWAVKVLGPGDQSLVQGVTDSCAEQQAVAPVAQQVENPALMNAMNQAMNAVQAANQSFIPPHQQGLYAEEDLPF